MQIFFRLAAIMTLMLFLASIAACQATSPRGEEGDDNQLPSNNDEDPNADDDDDDEDDGPGSSSDDDDAPVATSLLTCETAGNGTTPVTGQAIVDPSAETLLFDLYEVEAASGDCIWIKGDNGAEGADMLAVVIDSSQAFYGLAEDYSQLDDDWGCSTPNAAGFGCPETSVTVEAPGPVLIGIAMWPEEGGAESADYTLNVAINGVDVELGAPVADDQPLQ